MNRSSSSSIAQKAAKQKPAARPLIAIQSNRRPYKSVYMHGVDQHYVGAIENVADADICLVPCLAAPQVQTLLDRVDGIVLTGGLTNVNPEHYGVVGDKSYEPFDRAREQTSFCLVQEARRRKLPLLAICLGMQEVNVALGGSLQNNVQDKPGHLPHRDNHDPDPQIRYAQRHRVQPLPNGRLAALLGDAPFEVNSLHQQAVDRLADCLRPEAKAKDGIVEAVSLKSPAASKSEKSEKSEQFFLGVQWHPEYRADANPQSQKLFAALGAAARAYAAHRG